ncbi:MAG: hypothetical protein R3F15_09985 [Lysobacterales bacterium]
MSIAFIYAEIHLSPADTRDAVRGQLVYLWYPAPLVKRRQEDRNLTISVTVLKPNASAGDGDAASTMLFQLDGVVPGHEVKIGQLLTMGSWTGVPVFPSEEAIKQVLKINASTPMPSKLGLAPVNVEVVINEKAGPNPFLQWLSRVLGTDASKTKLQTAVQAAVVPSQRAQAEKAESDAAFAAEQAFREARSKALTAQSNFLLKCGELANTTNHTIAQLAVDVAQVFGRKKRRPCVRLRPRLMARSVKKPDHTRHARLHHENGFCQVGCTAVRCARGPFVCLSLSLVAQISAKWRTGRDGSTLFLVA